VNVENVTASPLTVMVRDSGALTVEPFGTPNPRLAGDVETFCARVTFPLTSSVQSRSKHTATPRKPIAKNLIVPSLRAYHINSFLPIIHLRRENDAGWGRVPTIRDEQAEVILTLASQSVKKIEDKNLPMTARAAEKQARRGANCDSNTGTLL
jgi:hypothetical protein